jgi:DNA helicase-2/ATP-dependent DNA helicase PcrA
VAWNDDLSPEQERFASYDTRVLRLVAGPGTGKTRVMTRRVAYLIEVGGVDPSSILALTFTRAAARELRERLEQLLGQETGERPAVYTLHAFALRQLLKQGGAPNLPHPIRIADDYDEDKVVAKEIAVLSGMTKRQVQEAFEDLGSDFETLKADEDEWLRTHPNPRFVGAWQRHREIYGYTLRGELVYALKKLLDHDPEVELEPAFGHVLADEYQDLNKCEIAVLRRLVGNGRTLFAAGDDDQSIYGFRNAFPLGLREFDKDYPDAESAELVECHRCDKAVLEMALNVARQDTERIEKDLGPLNDAAEGVVEAYVFGTANEEARGVAQICKWLKDEHGIAPGQMLILLRSNPKGACSDPFVRALADVGLEAELPSDPFAILREDAPRQVVSLLRLLDDSEDGLAWRELLELRSNGLGEGSLMAVYRFADEQGIRYYPALRAIADAPDVIDHRMRNRIADEVATVESILEELRAAYEMPPEEGLEAVFAVVAFDTDDQRHAVLELLLGLPVDVGADEEGTLEDVADALLSSRGAMDEVERTGDEERVQLMTMHSAKGLTADAVIVASCDDELVPGDTEDRRDLDDQRRLLYVSLTRARHFLYVTYARRRGPWESNLLQLPQNRQYTRFLRDYLPPEPA